MGGMLTIRAEYWLRVGAGLGLLLLLATQEKVCPWLHLAANDAATDAVDAGGDQTTPPDPRQRTESDAESKSEAPPLPLLLPDATAPRWPAVFGDVSVDHVTSARDGVVACGARGPVHGGAPLPAITRPAWHALNEPEIVTPAPRRARAHGNLRDPAICTSILPIGPPRG
jgi:hypothetical protein